MKDEEGHHENEWVKDWGTHLAFGLENKLAPPIPMLHPENRLRFHQVK